jgi:acyl-CoA thioester hydrolase
MPEATGGAVRHRHLLSPRYLEVDRQGVVFNMWYLAYFDDAVAGFLAAGGLPYPQLLAAGYDVSLVHTDLDWSAGLAYGDQAVIEVLVEAVGRTSFTLGFEVLREGRSLCRARTVYVVVADDGGGKREIPPSLLAVLTG